MTLSKKKNFFTPVRSIEGPDTFSFLVPFDWLYEIVILPVRFSSVLFLYVLFNLLHY